MLNRKKTERFVFRLYQLIVEQKFSLQESLEIISRQKTKNENARKCGIFLKRELENGNVFSTALRKCPFINFDEVFISFISFAEKSGFLNSALKFLKEREERRAQFFSGLIEACIYPVFIIFLTLGLCVFLAGYGKAVFGREIIGFEKLVKGISFLAFFTVLSFLFLKKNFTENSVYEAFLAIGFLLKSGIKTTTAVGLGILVTGEASAAGIFLTKARMNLEYGMDLFRAFDSEKKGEKLLGEDCMEQFFFGARGGNEWEIFERIAAEIKVRDEKRRKMVLCMLEPAFIGITGIFLMFLLCDFIVPLTNGFNLEF